MKFIIAYDIANPRRLRKVAKRLEQCAVRVQKSVFVFHGTRKDLAAVKGDLVGLIDVAEDRVQAFARDLRERSGSFRAVKHDLIAAGVEELA